MKGIPQKQNDGSIIWDSVGLDITHQKEMEIALERMNANLEKLVQERAEKAIKLSNELELYWLAAENSKSGVWRYDVVNQSL
jgi:nitrogen fixation protein FixH